MTYISREYRCIHCNKLFFRGELVLGKIEIKCRYCKYIVDIEVQKEDNFANLR